MECKYCHEEIEPEWDECPACGASIENEYRCKSCGKELKANWIKCPACKTPTQNNTPQAKTPRESSDAPENRNDSARKKTGYGQRNSIRLASGEVYDTISEAIDACKRGGRILVGPGSYFEDLNISKDVEIIGEGEVNEVMILSAESEQFPVSVLSVSSGSCSIKGISLSINIEDWNICQAVVVYEGAALSISNCNINGGVNVMGSVRGVTSNFDGGTILISGTAANLGLNNCSFHDGDGLNLQLGGQAELSGCKIYDQGKTGIMISDRSRITAKECIITRNEIGLWANEGSSGLFERCDFRGNYRGSAAKRPGSNIVGRNNLND